MGHRKRLAKEKADIMDESNEYKLNIYNSPFILNPMDDNNLTIYTGFIIGPKNTPYEYGKFKFTLTLSDQHPFKPPRFNFNTYVYHPNIKENGAVCLDILKNEWSPALTASKVLLSIRSLLSDPNPDDPLVPEISNLYKTDKEKYEETVRKAVLKYAIQEEDLKKELEKKINK